MINKINQLLTLSLYVTNFAFRKIFAIIVVFAEIFTKNLFFYCYVISYSFTFYILPYWLISKDQIIDLQLSNQCIYLFIELSIYSLSNSGKRLKCKTNLHNDIFYLFSFARTCRKKDQYSPLENEVQLYKFSTLLTFCSLLISFVGTKFSGD